jgi:hypothetical protein
VVQPDGLGQTQAAALAENDVPTAVQPAGPTESAALAENDVLAAVQPDGLTESAAPAAENHVPAAVRPDTSSHAEPPAPSENNVPIEVPTDASTPLSREPVSEDNPGVARPKLWNRRRIVVLGVSASAGLVAGIWPCLVKKFAQQGPKHGQYRKIKSSAIWTKISDEKKEGFYLLKHKPSPSRRSKSRVAKNSIIHYVDAQKRLLFVRSIKEENLRPATSGEIAFSTPKNRVHLDRASASFEIAALEQINNGQYVNACQLLVNGIKHDLAFKKKIGGGPSLRLFDLLAIIAKRQNLPHYENELTGLAEQARVLVGLQNIGTPPRRKSPKNSLPGQSKKPAGSLADRIEKRKAAFEDRIEKWNSGGWKTRMQGSKVSWAITLAPDTIKTKNEIRHFEIAAAKTETTKPPSR